MEFLRFTTLIVDPQDRQRAFAGHLDIQKSNNMPGSEDIELKEFIELAENEILSPEELSAKLF